MTAKIKSLQKAIYSILSPIISIYDNANSNEIYPFSVFSDERSIIIDGADFSGEEINTTLEIYSRNNSRQEILDISDDIVKNLHLSTPTLDNGNSLAYLHVNSTDIFAQNTNITWRAIIKLQAFIYK